MKHLSLNNSYRLTVKKENQKLHYYLRMKCGKQLYLFTRSFSPACYRMCKENPLINDILYRREKNTAIMNLVKYMKRMMPYFIDYYNLQTV